jgi:flagellar motor switch protein FliN
VSQELELEQLGGEQAAGSGAPPRNDLRRLREVPVEVSVEMGRAKMTVGETLELRPGSIVPLDRMAGEPVDLLINGTPIARGEVVVIDEQFGLRITDVLGQPDAEKPAQADAEPAPETPAAVS